MITERWYPVFKFNPWGCGKYLDHMRVVKYFLWIIPIGSYEVHDT